LSAINLVVLNGGVTGHENAATISSAALRRLARAGEHVAALRKNNPRP
jgi:hypothetical protein